MSRDQVGGHDRDPFVRDERRRTVRCFRLALVLVAAALIPTEAASGDGCTPAECGLFSSTVPGSRYVVFRTNGDRGPLQVYDVTARRQVLSLPAGMITADGRRFVRVRIVGRTRTVLTRYALPAGRRLSTVALNGRYRLAAVSRRGRRVVLVKGGPPRTATTFAIVDGGRAVERVRFRGRYDVETLSPDGRRLFLVHWKNTGYDLRLYDLAARRLRPTPTFEPDGGREKMVGTAWRGLATRDGTWLLTLYLEGGGGFVHALDLRRAIGFCIDLPARGALALGASALTLSPDERTLYVASPVLGRVYTIDLRRPRLARVTRFEPWLGPDEVSFTTAPNAAVSPNGRMIYFNGNGLLWAYDTASARVRGPYPARRVVTALGFTLDGRRVVAFGGDGRSTVLDAATGRRMP
jgi:hypothetical protein